MDSNMKIFNGVLFKLFSGSLNTKRSSSDLVFFMLVKVFEGSSPAIGYLFLSSDSTIYEKGTLQPIMTGIVL